MGRKKWPTSVLKLGLLVLVFALVGVGAAQADPIPTTCSAPNPDDCNGATYAVVVTDVDSNTLNVKFVIDVDGYSGNATDFVKSVAFSIGGVNTYASLDLLSAPGGAANWLESTKELSNGQGGGCTGGGTNSSCAQAISTFNGGKGIPISSADADGQLIWEFQFDIGADETPGDAAHIKYLYVDADGKKIGSLGSFNTPTSGTPGSPGGTPGTPGSPGGTPGTPVPEPGTLTLLGCGLIGMANLFRKNVRK